METVSINIPAALYCDIYARHGGRTNQEIVKLLHQLTHATPDVDESRSYRPGENTITGRVWAIADRLKLEHGRTNRNQVVETCMKEGINVNTANTQYSQWAKTNN